MIEEAGNPSGRRLALAVDILAVWVLWLPAGLPRHARRLTLPRGVNACGDGVRTARSVSRTTRGYETLPGSVIVRGHVPRQGGCACRCWDKGSLPSSAAEAAGESQECGNGETWKKGYGLTRKTRAGMDRAGPVHATTAGGFCTAASSGMNGFRKTISYENRYHMRLRTRAMALILTSGTQSLARGHAQGRSASALAGYGRGCRRRGVGAR
ncbi:hypothetical protein BV20DRAFT_655808 [Pilatotrama ljubarskyi]|nr:hypothetical protein BV20DRAFT_655808 [Pilatotrama ljubarskyi]